MKPANKSRATRDRWRVELTILTRFLPAWESVEDVLEQYPSLKRSDIEAAFGYASRLTSNRYTTELSGTEMSQREPMIRSLKGCFTGEAALQAATLDGGLGFLGRYRRYPRLR